MMNAPQTLSEDATILQEMVIALDVQIQTRDAEIHNQQILIEKLQAQLSGMQRHRFGQSSEKQNQIELALESEEIGVASQPQEAGASQEEPPLKNQPKRKPLPDNLRFCRKV